MCVVSVVERRSRLKCVLARRIWHAMMPPRTGRWRAKYGAKADSGRDVVAMGTSSSGSPQLPTQLVRPYKLRGLLEPWLSRAMAACTLPGRSGYGKCRLLSAHST
jgi:hypothetical protein